MLLGAGELGKEVIISLQRLGVEVIAVDRYANAPGHQVAHRSHVINMTDEKLLSDVINSEKPHFIVPEIEAINIGCLEKIEKQGLSTIIHSVVKTILAIDAAFCNVERVTLAGSMIPISNMFPNSFVAAL